MFQNLCYSNFLMLAGSKLFDHELYIRVFFFITWSFFFRRGSTDSSPSFLLEKKVNSIFPNGFKTHTGVTLNSNRIHHQSYSSASLPLTSAMDIDSSLAVFECF